MGVIEKLLHVLAIGECKKVTLKTKASYIVERLPNQGKNKRFMIESRNNRDEIIKTTYI